MTLEQMQAHLLDDPFDVDVRRRYAEALEQAERTEEAIRQWRLLAKQRPEDGGVALRLAELLAEVDREEAAELYRGARGKSGFEPSETLEGRLGLAKKPVFSVISGEGAAPSAEVLPLTSAEKIRFADVVGMRDLKKTVRLKIIEPFKNPGLFARFRKKTGGGILLYGPPGCGKTMMAKAIAFECEATFTSVGISDVLNMFQGESERQLAALFERARAKTPAVLFFDELDALAYSRSKASSEHTRTLVNEFLAQLDGVGATNEQMLVLAATNMPWDVDPAMKRPGRFDRQIFVPPPDAEARAEMFRVSLTGLPTENIDEATLARLASNYSGADIHGVIERAKESVLEDILGGGDQDRPIRQADLLAALEESEPSTLEWLKTAKNLVKYGGRDGGYKEVEKYLRAERLY